MSKLNTPILFVAFNRPSSTRKVFEQIKKAKPKKLFISIDGPRNEKEKIKVDEVKKIVSKIDWPCKVRTLFRDKNLGCKSVALAITWFFENVKQGIILEDDCFPTMDFFKFCSEILEKYKDDERIMHIAGHVFRNTKIRDKYSYYFSHYPYMWGWATWKRAWDKIDFQMKLYPLIKNKDYFLDIYPNKIERNFIKRYFDFSHSTGDFQTWDNPWMFTIVINNGLVIVPNKNLVKNLGFDKLATHTSSKLDSYLSSPTQELRFPLIHPPFVIRDNNADLNYVKWALKHKIKKQFLLKTGFYKIFTAFSKHRK